MADVNTYKYGREILRAVSDDLLASYSPPSTPKGDHHESARSILDDERPPSAPLDLARYEVADIVVRAWRASESVVPLLATIERLADDGGVVPSTDTLLTKAAEIAERHTIFVYAAAADDAGHRPISCDERDLVSKGLAAFPSDASDEGPQ